MNALDALPLLRHMEWADALVWRGVLALPPSPAVEAAFRDRLAHVHVVQRAFLQMWQKAPITALAETEKLTDLTALLAWTRPAYAEGQATIAALGIADFERPIVVPWSQYYVAEGRDPALASLAETIVQVTSHTTHHRGQLNTLLRSMGITPSNTDFIAWVWQGKPAPDWSRSA
jgi:uncharacterized damage-inducible protein DinB